jgi:hypothetical protein
MCFLKVYSTTTSFSSFAKTTSIPIYSRSDRNPDSEHFKISFDVSDRDWDDLKGQVEDAILFLTKYQTELESLFLTHKVSDAFLDFPIFSRLDNEIVNQNDHFPRRLVSIAGKLNIGIELGIYSRDAFQSRKN